MTSTEHIRYKYKICIDVKTDVHNICQVKIPDTRSLIATGFINNLSIKHRLTSNASIFTAEVTAIDLALNDIAESDDDHFIIF